MKYAPPKWAIRGAIVVVIAALLITAFVTRGRWLPGLTHGIQTTIASFRGESPDEAAGDADEEHDHDHGSSEVEAIELSPQARRMLKLEGDGLGEIRLTTFRPSVTVPALIVERPGWSRRHVVTPLTGVITEVHIAMGEAVAPGILLFQIRLTHEDLVQAQEEYLTALGALDVERREIARLKELQERGTIPLTRLLEREYEKDKLDAKIAARSEALLLHGLNEEQVVQIAETRKLLRELRIYAPPKGSASGELQLTNAGITQASLQEEDAEQNGGTTGTAGELYVVHRLDVQPGQAVSAGESLCELADYSELYIQGQAFERDAASVLEAASRDWKVTAVLEEDAHRRRIFDDLDLLFVENDVDPETRLVHFYVALPNEVARDNVAADGRRYIGWKYRPGQRLDLQVPVDEWPGRIVLPARAVTKDGAEHYVFQQNGDEFIRRPVTVEYRDPYQVVLANDGSLFPGDIVALHSAQQLQMALKNEAGGGVDPHAGHSH